MTTSTKPEFVDSLQKSDTKKISGKSAYSYIKENLRANLKSKLIEWRKQPVVFKLEKPTDIGKARILGYKDKKGFVIARVRILRGGRKRAPIHHNRRSVRQTVRKNLMMNYQEVAEQRANRKFINLEVLNSYMIAKDGQNYFFEIILVDPQMPEIKNDKTINWICMPENRKRVFRGLTTAGKRSKS